MIDGMATDGMFGNGQCACVYNNENQTQEVVVQVAGGAAEHRLSGVLVNRIPKYGGNTFQADSQLLFSNGNLQGDNVDDALRARNMLTPAQLAEQFTTSTSASAGPSAGPAVVLHVRAPLDLQQLCGRCVQPGRVADGE